MLYEEYWRIINASSITEFGLCDSEILDFSIKRKISYGPCDISLKHGVKNVDKP
jgi:hypothetical protein